MYSWVPSNCTFDMVKYFSSALYIQYIHIKMRLWVVRLWVVRLWVVRLWATFAWIRMRFISIGASCL